MSLWPNGTGVLQQLGLLQAVASRGQSGTHFLVRSQSGNVLMEIGTAEAETPTVCVHRAHLLRILADALPPESLAVGHELAEMQFAGDQVDLRFTNGERLFVTEWWEPMVFIPACAAGFSSLANLFTVATLFFAASRMLENFSVGHNSESWERAAALAFWPSAKTKCAGMQR